VIGAEPDEVLQVTVTPVDVSNEETNPVGAGDIVVTEMAVDGTDVPPAFVAVIVTLLYTAFAINPVIVRVFPDREDARTVVAFLTV
jgi:hypothetical protein